MVGSGDHLNIRTPMQWDDSSHAGFTTGTPWHPVNWNYETYNVEDEAADPNSLLEWYKKLIHVRNGSPALRRGAHHRLEPSTWEVMSHVRSDSLQSVLVMINTSSYPQGSFTLTGSDSSLEPGEHTLVNLLDPGDTLDVTVTPSHEITGLSLAAYEVAVYEFAGANGVDPGDDDSPQTGLLLRQSYPNPFGPSTTISYSLPSRSHVRLGVYDVAGRAVATIHDGVQLEGPHEATWDGTDDAGTTVGAGMYFVRLAAAGNAKTSKLMLLK
jgi:hypothetical protein